MLFSIRKAAIRVNPGVCRQFATAAELISSEKKVTTEDLVPADKDYEKVRREGWKCSKIAILGVPNAGKSTLVNQLVHRQICAASSKVHTTRVKTQAVFHHENTQLIFIDTPGTVSEREMKKHRLEASFKKDTKASMLEADVVGVLQDASNIFTRETIDNRILDLLKETKVGVPSLLILNKVDKMKSKRKLLDLVTTLTGENGWPNFSDVFMVSALSGDGVDDLRDYFLDTAKSRDWVYKEEDFTDQPPEKIVERAVHARLLDSLPKELPYQLRVRMEYFNYCEDGSVVTTVLVHCPSDRISKLVLGKGGCRIKNIAADAEQELTNAFQQAVRLKIAVQFKEKKSP